MNKNRILRNSEVSNITAIRVYGNFDEFIQ